jgi:segregation and condensation protein A
MSRYAYPFPVLGEDYRVKLESFEGPLDLLLFLIRKNEVDIHDIPIAAITDQYLGYVAQFQHAHASRLDIDEAGEFLVMAAMLTEIKSRMLMPRPAHERSDDGSSPAPAEDPRAELVRQLLEYKRYRDAADALEQRADEWARRYGAARAAIDNDALKDVLAQQAPDLDLEDLSLVDLVEAFKKIVDTVNFDKLGEHQVTFDDTPLEIHAADIVARLNERAAAAPNVEVELREFFHSRTRSEMVGLFLALLELVRNGKVGVRQAGVGGAILVRPKAPEAQPTPAE